MWTEYVMSDDANDSINIRREKKIAYNEHRWFMIHDVVYGKFKRWIDKICIMYII